MVCVSAIVGVGMLAGTFPWVVTACTLVDGVAGAWGLLGGWGTAKTQGSRRVGAGRVLMAAVLAGMSFGFKLPFLAGAGVGAFGLMRLAFVDGVFLIPLASLAVLVMGARGRASLLACGLACLGLLAGGVGVYANQVEPFRLRVETARVPLAAERAGRGTITVGVLTDFQTEGVEDYERGAIARLMAGKPDLILMPGDVFQGSESDFERELPALREALRVLEAPGGVFLVPGDVDPGDRVERLAEGTRMQTLVNRVARVEVGGRRLAIGGVELHYDSGAAREVVRELEDAGGDAGEIRILLGHRPDVALLLKSGSRVDLVVAGHTHGGQVVIPGFGPPMTLSKVPRVVAAGGLHKLNGNPIYVSRGVGCERGQAPRIRFWCPPEVSLLSLGPSL